MLQSFIGLFREQPGVYQSWTRTGLLVGIGSTFAYALLALQSTSMEMWTHDLAVIALVVALFRAPRAARMEPVFWFFSAVALLSLFSYAQTNLFLPEYAEDEVVFNKLSALFGFVAVAWWIGGDTRRMFVVLALALVGLIATTISYGQSEIEQALAGRRVNFGFHNAQHTAMFYATALIGWSVFSVRFLRPKTVWRYVAWALVLFVLVAGVVVTQTRAAWLGLLAAGSVVAGFGLMLARRVDRSRLFTIILKLVIAAAVSVALAAYFAKPVGKRLNAERAVIEKVTQGDLSSLPNSGTGARIQLWREAVNRIAERPLIGWGYTIRARFIAESENLPEALKRFGHVHSSYLEILLIYGLVGLVLFASLIIYVTSRVWNAWRSRELPDDVAVFGFGFLAFWTVVNLFESYIFGKTGTYLMALVVGSVYTFPLAARLRCDGQRGETGVSPSSAPP